MWEPSLKEVDKVSSQEALSTFVLIIIKVLHMMSFVVFESVSAENHPLVVANVANEASVCCGCGLFLLLL